MTPLLASNYFGFPASPTGTGSALENAPTSPRPPLAAPVWSPDNPMFWFGALLAGAAALVLFSGRVHVSARATAD